VTVILKIEGILINVVLIKNLGKNAKLIEYDWHNTHKSQKMTNSKIGFFFTLI
jgi:hypothetical protein